MGDQGCPPAGSLQAVGCRGAESMLEGGAWGTPGAVQTNRHQGTHSAGVRERSMVPPPICGCRHAERWDGGLVSPRHIGCRRVQAPQQVLAV